MYLFFHEKGPKVTISSLCLINTTLIYLQTHVPNRGCRQPLITYANGKEFQTYKVTYMFIFIIDEADE